jgi:hypothetical protein
LYLYWNDLVSKPVFIFPYSHNQNNLTMILNFASTGNIFPEIFFSDHSDSNFKA